MSSTCQNCKTALSCGCQKRVASNGVQVCSTCITAYENNLLLLKNGPVKNAPSNVKVLYTPGIVKK